MEVSGRPSEYATRSLGERSGYTLRFGRHLTQMAIKPILVDGITLGEYVE
jgi:hypothetical protein